MNNAITECGKPSLRICGLGAYLPISRVDNAHFSALTGRPADWFEDRTGIRTRHRAAEGENANTMAVSAVRILLEQYPASIDQVDLVLGASYTPWDTVGTLAHRVQREFGIENARVLYISSACSSFLNAIEIADAFTKTGRCNLALVVASEHNSAFSDDADDRSGRLWGDGAAAALLSTEALAPSLFDVVGVRTRGLGHSGRGPEGVYLEPIGRGLQMPYGADVFANACRHMAAEARDLLRAHNLSVEDLALLIPHQANQRIIAQVASELTLDPTRVASTVAELGNTGCASIPISLCLYADRVAPGELVLAVAFGGGYSVGAALLRKT